MSSNRRLAIVTGAAGGIGREIVAALVNANYNVAAWDQDAQGLAGYPVLARHALGRAETSGGGVGCGRRVLHRLVREVLLKNANYWTRLFRSA